MTARHCSGCVHYNATLTLNFSESVDHKQTHVLKSCRQQSYKETVTLVTAAVKMSSLASLNKKKVCVNPFSRKKCSLNRRQVSDWMIKKNSILTKNDYICDTCRNQLRGLPNVPLIDVASDPVNVETIDEHEMEHDADDEPFFSREHAVESLNKFLDEVNVSPVKEQFLCRKQYCNSKISAIVDVLKTKVFENCELDNGRNDGDIILEQLKRKMSESSNKTEKVKLLTIVPRNWSAAKVGLEFPGNSDCKYF